MAEKADNRPTVDQLREWFTLDAETGRLYWRQSNGGFRRVGQEAMKSKRRNGARFGRLPGYPNMVAAAVVVWAMDRGRWPEGQVGHANADLTDNRPGNLVADGEGTARRSVRTEHPTRAKGVTPHGDRYRARGYSRGVMVHLGSFDTVAEATQAIERFERLANAPDKRQSAP